MFVKAFKDDIIDGVHKSANIIPAKTGAAFLRTIWLRAQENGLAIMSTDSNLEFCGSYQVDIVDEGLVGVQGRSFHDLIRRLPPGQITFTLDPETKNLLIEQNTRKYKLPTNDVTWFQNFSSFPEDGAVVWSGDLLQEIIERIAFCISEEDHMEAIACLSFKPVEKDTAIEVCGLNGHQFAMIRFFHDELHAMLPKEGVLIQRKYINELKKWLASDEIELTISEKRLFFRTGDKKETFSLPLSYYQYPDYNNFLAKLAAEDVSRLTLNRAEAIEALERLAIFNSENNRCTYFDFKGNELVLTAQGQEVGSATETLQVGFEGALARIAFPTRNFIDILGHFVSEKVTLILTGGEGPCGVRGEDDPEYTVIVMPMKIVEETYYSEEGI